MGYHIHRLCSLLHGYTYSAPRHINASYHKLSHQTDAAKRTPYDRQKNTHPLSHSQSCRCTPFLLPLPVPCHGGLLITHRYVLLPVCHYPPQHLPLQEYLPSASSKDNLQTSPAYLHPAVLYPDENISHILFSPVRLPHSMLLHRSCTASRSYRFLSAYSCNAVLPDPPSAFCTVLDHYNSIPPSHLLCPYSLSLFHQL